MIEKLKEKYRVSHHARDMRLNGQKALALGPSTLVIRPFSNLIFLLSKTMSLLRVYDCNPYFKNLFHIFNVFRKFGNQVQVFLDLLEGFILSNEPLLNSLKNHLPQP